MEKLILNKNRGWRGLAEAKLISESGDTEQKMIFSFSQPVWEDMLKGRLVMQDDDNYIVLKFSDPDYELPRPFQQRSVLIKNVILNIDSKVVYPKATWPKDHETPGDYNAICNFITNRNNHTQSDWNCIRNTCHSNYIIYKTKGEI